MIFAISNFILKKPTRVTKVSSYTTNKHQHYNKQPQNKAFLITQKSTKVTRNKLAQNAKTQDRSNIFKTEIKSTKATLLAPHTHQKLQNHQNHQGCTTFFEIQASAKLVPFPAVPNGSWNPIFRRRSNVVKIMVWTKIRPLETPPTGSTCQYYQGRVQKAASPARSQFSGILRNYNIS